MMQAARATTERKQKLARSYQELLDDFDRGDLKTVGNYQLGRLIGKGSFGKVYLASHKLTNGSKVCAAAVIPESGMGNKGHICNEADINLAGRAQVGKER